MKREFIVAPSLLAADFLRLGNDLDRVAEADIEWLHFDVMDGHFVPYISFGSEILKAIKKSYNFFFDVHIMVEEPVLVAKSLIEAGADLITFHYEAVDDPLETIAQLKALSPNIKVGMSIKPLSEVDDILVFIEYLDLILVMSVEPGKGGQKFNIESLDKIEQLRNFIDDNGLDCLIEVDGGINAETGPDAILAGADVLVAGTYIFHSNDISVAKDNLKPTEE